MAGISAQKIKLLGAGFLLLLFTAHDSFASKSEISPSANIKVLKNLEYARPEGKPQSLDLHLPEEKPAKKLPVIIIIHGGGWYKGDKEDFSELAGVFVSGGYAVASVNYRFFTEKVFPACLQDCIAAVKWLKENSGKYGLNDAKIGLFGDSSGGHLALMTAFAGEGAGFGNCGRVQAVAVWYPVTDILMYYAKNPKLNKGLMGKTPEENPEEYKRASPVNYASKENPPVFLLHGEQDKVVPIKHSEKLAELLKDAGAGVLFLRVKNAGHGFGPGSNSNIEPEYSA
ncbi:MAG: alpha/beta hydrolase, partial [Candidatus Firestonebacteria bacterium]